MGKTPPVSFNLQNSNYINIPFLKLSSLGVDTKLDGSFYS